GDLRRVFAFALTNDPNTTSADDAASHEGPRIPFRRLNMPTTKTGWIWVGVILLGIGGAAHAADQTAEPMGAPASPSATSPGMTSPSAASPSATDTSQTMVAVVCKDMGVTVSFNTDSYTLDVNAKGALDGVTKWMQSRPGRTLKLRGYADPTGSPEANLT